MSEFSYATDTGLKWPKARTKRKTTDHIQVHHTVGDYGTPAKWASLHKRRQEQGQKGVPYSYLVLADGTIFAGRSHPYSHGGVKDSLTNNANQRSVAIAFNGDMREDGQPTQKALEAAKRLVNDLMAMYGVPIDKVIGHKEVPLYSNGKPTGKTYATACPCIDMDWLRGYFSDGKPVPQPDPEPEPEPKTFPFGGHYSGDTHANIRKSPNANSLVVGRIENDEQGGEHCIVLGKDGDWYEVVMHEQAPMVRGWVKKFISAKEVV